MVGGGKDNVAIVPGSSGHLVGRQRMRYTHVVQTDCKLPTE